MRALAILGRLCWKEFRLGWVILVLGLALPPLATELAKDHVTFFKIEFTTITLFLLMTAISVWAATLASGNRDRKTYADSHFALNPAWSLAITFIFQGLVVLIIGWNYACWTSSLHQLPPYEKYQLTQYYQHYLDMMVVAYFCVSLLYFWVAYVIGYIVSKALSSWAGMVAGIAWMLGNSFAFEYLTFERSYKNLFLQYEGTHFDIYLIFFGICAIAGIAAFLILLIPVRSHIRIQRIIALVVFGAVTIGLPVGSSFFTRTETPTEFRERLCSSDGSLAVEIVSGRPTAEPNSELHFADYRQLRSAIKQFPKTVIPIGFVGRDTAIVASQMSGEKKITLLSWDIHSNAVTPMLSFRAKRGVLAGHTERRFNDFASVSPDSHYALIAVHSPYGLYMSKSDIWKIDLRRRKAALLLPSYSFYGRFSWAGDSVILSSSQTKISLATGQVETLRLPLPGESKR